MHSQMNEVMNCWEQHFKTHLNTTFPHNPEAIQNIPDPQCDAEPQGSPTTGEVREAVKYMKDGKALGVDEITVEVLKIACEPMIQMLDKICRKVWLEEKSPKDWS